MPLFRGSSRCESLILSHRSRFTCECNKEEIDDDDNETRKAGPCNLQVVERRQPPSGKPARFKDKYFAELWIGSVEGSYLRLIDFCIDQLWAESNKKEEDETRKALVSLSLRLKDLLAPVTRVKKKRRRRRNLQAGASQSLTCLFVRKRILQGYLTHIKNSAPLGPYSSPAPRALCWS